MGVGRETVEAILKEEYKEDLKLDETIKLAAKCLIKALEARGEAIRFKLAVVPTTTKRLRMLTDEEIEGYKKGLQGSGAP